MGDSLSHLDDLLSFIYIRSMQVSIFREMVKNGSLVKNAASYSEQCTVRLIQAN